MTRSLCQEVTKNWHSIPSNRTTACSGSNVSVALGIVSLTLGNSGFPFGDRGFGEVQKGSQLFLGDFGLFPKPDNIITDSDFCHKRLLAGRSSAWEEPPAIGDNGERVSIVLSVSYPL